MNVAWNYEMDKFIDMHVFQKSSLQTCYVMLATGLGCSSNQWLLPILTFIQLSDSF